MKITIGIAWSVLSEMKQRMRWDTGWNGIWLVMIDDWLIYDLWWLMNDNKWKSHTNIRCRSSWVGECNCIVRENLSTHYHWSSLTIIPSFNINSGRISRFCTAITTTIPHSKHRPNNCINLFITIHHHHSSFIIHSLILRHHHFPTPQTYHPHHQYITHEEREYCRSHWKGQNRENYCLTQIMLIWVGHGFRRFC